MRQHIKHILTAIIVLSVTISFAQVRDNDTIRTGVINVVKPYTPTISDAFKVKEVPTLDDKETLTKKEIKYNIFSFPVASTFTPAKGKAATVEKVAPIKLFDNYATLGVGTYKTILGEVYLNHSINRNESVGGYVSHHSSQGGIENLEFDDNFSDSRVNVNYASRLKDLSWNVEAGFQHQLYNWYGVPQSQIAAAQTNGTNTNHTFYGGHIGGDLKFEDTYIKSGSVLFRRFGDDQGSGENRFTAKIVADVPINNEEISTDLTIDYLNGGFDREYMTNTELNYGNFQIGLSPTYVYKQDDLTLNFGASAFYLNDTEGGKNKLYLYPKVTASYRLVDEVLIAYGGVVGDLIQNSYYDFASDNPFVSPTLNVEPTNQLYNMYIGLKGKLSSNVSYNVHGRFIADRNKALFRNNVITATTQNYAYGNSFGIVYDDVRTFSVAGEVNVDVSRNFQLGMKATYFKYKAENEIEAWNLPDFEGSIFLDYQISKQWFAGANMFFVGERNDQFFVSGTPSPTTIVLDSYFDINAHVGYNISDQLSVFAKANNIANNEYQRWQNFPVQSIQFLAGATYKFDF